MAAFTPPVVDARLARVLSPIFLAAALALGGCGKDHSAELQQGAQAKVELQTANEQLATLKKQTDTATDQLDLAKSDLAKARDELAEKSKAIAQRDNQIATLQKDLEAAKKQDANLFVEATALRQQGLNTSAITQYQKILSDFPHSPLVPYATAAVAEMNAQKSREDQRRVDAVVASKRPEAAVLKYFGDGQTTLGELAPILKSKSLAQVVKMLGKPDRTFNDGTEIGYSDKALNPATSRPGLLIIAFDEGTVSSIRVEYSGRKVVP
jgi:hypothetical protein